MMAQGAQSRHLGRQAVETSFGNGANYDNGSQAMLNTPVDTSKVNLAQLRELTTIANNNGAIREVIKNATSWPASLILSLNGIADNRFDNSNLGNTPVDQFTQPPSQQATTAYLSSGINHNDYHVARNIGMLPPSRLWQFDLTTGESTPTEMSTKSTTPSAANLSIPLGSSVYTLSQSRMNNVRPFACSNKIDQFSSSCPPTSTAASPSTSLSSKSTLINFKDIKSLIASSSNNVLGDSSIT